MFNPAMASIPAQCEIIFRQDLRPGDTILPLQSQRLLITLADNTPSELQPIVIKPQYHGHGSISHHDTTALPAGYTAPSEATARRPSIANFVATPYVPNVGGQAHITTKKTPEPEPDPKRKMHPRGNRIRRSRL